RTGDVDLTGPADPASQPPRVASPGEALHGRYHFTTSENVVKREFDSAVRTDCLRTGDRCLSYFHGPNTELPLLFESGKWTGQGEGVIECRDGGTAQLKASAEYPLPATAQNPITLLIGHAHQVVTGCISNSTDIEEKLERTGD
ncbi:MAG: serine/threonine-protein kinase, partial [Mycobacterium sp.]